MPTSSYSCLGRRGTKMTWCLLLSLNLASPSPAGRKFLVPNSCVPPGTTSPMLRKRQPRISLASLGKNDDEEGIACFALRALLRLLQLLGLRLCQIPD